MCAHKLTTDELHRMTIDEFRASEKLPLTVVLDNVRSQFNIGSVFRTADAFGIEEIALCGICSTPPHREIHKSALGAEMSVNWTYHEQTSNCIHMLKQRGYQLFAVEQVEGSILLGDHTIDAPTGKIAIVLGNEVEGVSQEVVDLCDGAIEIPQYGTKHSLNVSCAAAIVMWELCKMLKQK